jgi:hypothetical protein
MNNTKPRRTFHIFLLLLSIFFGMASGLSTRMMRVSADWYCPVQETDSCICWGCQASGSPRKCFCGSKQGQQCSPPNCKEVTTGPGEILP